MPSGSTARLSDQIGQDSDCYSCQSTFSVRAEENQQHLPKTERTPHPLQEPEGIEHPRGSMRDKVVSENPLHGVGGTGQGIRKGPRNVARSKSTGQFLKCLILKMFNR